jgi:hypothetical protein
MVVVEKRIWKLRVVMCYKPQRQLKMEKNYIGIITMIVSVQIAINGSTTILIWGYNIRSVPSAKITENQKSTVLGARDTFALIVMTVSKLTYFNYTIKSYLLKIFSLTLFSINSIFSFFSISFNYFDIVSSCPC